jgi:hypothetical protein
MQRDGKKIIKIALFSALFVFILIYGLIKSWNLIFGINIKKVNIENGAKFSDSILHVTGIAKNAIYLSLNDREISIDQAGNFNETISLLPGYNTITIIAKDKFGNSDEENYQLIYEPEVPVLEQNNNEVKKENPETIKPITVPKEDTEIINTDTGIDSNTNINTETEQQTNSEITQ